MGEMIVGADLKAGEAAVLAGDGRLYPVASGRAGLVVEYDGLSSFLNVRTVDGSGPESCPSHRPAPEPLLSWRQKPAQL